VTARGLKNDCFALPAGVDWTPVDEALDDLRRRLHGVTDVETCAAATAAGRILAEPVAARRAHPPFSNSAVDGYGFALLDDHTGQVSMALSAGRAAAGSPFEGVLPAGQAVRILTGAQVPLGVDTIVLEEDVDLENGRVEFAAGLKRGANVRPKGEDVAKGDTILPAGRVLGPQDLALMASVGVQDINVFKRLRVGVLSTGDEIAAVGQDVSVARIYDANRPMLLAMIKKWGGVAVDLGRVDDSRDATRVKLNAAHDVVDVLITTGGASAGDEDHLSAILRTEGQLHSWRIALKPGRPLALGQWNRLPVFGLPGNPVAAFICALIFVRPALFRLGGADWIEAAGFDVPAAFSKVKKPGRREYLRARLDVSGCAQVFASEGSGRVSGISWADGLVELGDKARTVSPGDRVRYFPYAGFGL